jgi:hypothetical protein
MSQGIVNNGSCLCGAVTLSTTTMSPLVSACHCNMCRKWGGSALLVLNGFRYHDDWFRNFLIASSLNGRRPLISLSHTK